MQPTEQNASHGLTVTAEGEALPPDPRRIRYSRVVAPESGGHVRIADHVLWCRIPLPIDLNHINVWLIDDGEGCIAVDTGMAASMGKDAWEMIESQVFVRQPLKAVFITHIHPDHIGLAGWLQQRYRVPALMSARTHELAVALFGGDASHGAELGSFLRSHGIPQPEQYLSVLKPERFGRMHSGLPQVERFIDDADVLEWGSTAWTAIRTDGHAEGHLCLFNEAQKLLISGDQVLPTISSNISIMFRNGDTNPLDSYLRSLQRLRNLPDDTLVLPSHGSPFVGLQQRIDELRQHHEAQLAKVVQACEQPKSAFEILSVLFRRELAGMHLFLALGEAVAHLEYLAQSGDLERNTTAGVIRYASVRRIDAKGVERLGDQPD